MAPAELRVQSAFRSRRVVTPAGVRPATVLVAEGRIAAVHDGVEGVAPAGCELTDLGDLVLAPGLVDTHVHVNEPGRTDWEGYRSATLAAAAGGITTLVDMPLNSSPVTTTRRALGEKLAATDGKLAVDVGFWGGLVPGNRGELEALARDGVFGFKGFLVHSGIDDFPRVDADDLAAAMPRIEELGLPLLVHAELDHPGEAQAPASCDPRDHGAWLASRPHRWEVEAIVLMAGLCERLRCAVHVVHLSSAQALPVIARARDAGLPLSVETCPHYLALAAEEILPGDTRFKCAPPIREGANRDGLWRALDEGLVDFVVSDHSPCPGEMKLPERGDFFDAWGGIASLQLSLSVTWTEARRRGFGLQAVCDWLSRRPAAFLGLEGRKGAIAPGHDADMLAWDPEATFTVEPAMIRHRHKGTPYQGRRLYGRIARTVLRGRTVFQDGEPPRRPRGEVLLGPRRR